MYAIFVWLCIIAIAVVLQFAISPGLGGTLLWGGLLVTIGLAICEGHEESK